MKYSLIIKWNIVICVILSGQGMKKAYTKTLWN